jgi:hypothetical protein
LRVWLGYANNPRVSYPQYPSEDLSLSTRINQGLGGGQPAGDGGPVPRVFLTLMESVSNSLTIVFSTLKCLLIITEGVCLNIQQ